MGGGWGGRGRRVQGESEGGRPGRPQVSPVPSPSRTAPRRTPGDPGRGRHLKPGASVEPSRRSSGAAGRARAAPSLSPRAPGRRGPRGGGRGGREEGVRVGAGAGGGGTPDTLAHAPPPRTQGASPPPPPPCRATVLGSRSGSSLLQNPFLPPPPHLCPPLNGYFPRGQRGRSLSHRFQNHAGFPPFPALPATPHPSEGRASGRGARAVGVEPPERDSSRGRVSIFVTRCEAVRGEGVKTRGRGRGGGRGAWGRR